MAQQHRTPNFLTAATSADLRSAALADTFAAGWNDQVDGEAHDYSLRGGLAAAYMAGRTAAGMAQQFQEATDAMAREAAYRAWAIMAAARPEAA